ncbi:MAG: hypothetical protein IKH71_05680, partial [Oscillospiraceae bacterium]|nr:hypothetical protein [Oscillospiraceae bacterium]
MDNNNKKRSVAGKVIERIGDIAEEILEQYRGPFSDYEEERRRKRKQRMYEFYGGKPPRDRKTRELYIGLYFLKKTLQGIGTAIFTLFLM